MVKRFLQWLFGIDIQRFQKDVNHILEGLIYEIHGLQKDNETLTKQNEIFLEIFVEQNKRMDELHMSVLSHQKVLEQIVGVEFSDPEEEEDFDDAVLNTTWFKSKDKKDIN